MRKHLFITGKRWGGKSSLIRDYLRPYLPVAGGFFIQRVFYRSEYIAFRLVPLQSGEPYRLNLEAPSFAGLTNVIVARAEDNRWQAFPEVFETVGVKSITEALQQGKRILLLDELGHLELNAPLFQAAVFAALDGSIRALGVLKLETNPFLHRVRERADVKCVELLPGHQNQVGKQIERFLQAVNKE